MKDPLLVNKIMAAVVVALGIGWIANSTAARVVHPEMPAKPVYEVDMSVLGTAAASPSGGADAAADKGPAPIAPLLVSANPETGAKLAKVCSACHSFNKGEPAKLGPNLYGIIGAKHAHMAGYTYSAALTALGDKPWTYEDLNKFLYKPSAAVVGTKMPYAGMKSDTDRANIIAWLRTLADSPEPLPK